MSVSQGSTDAIQVIGHRGAAGLASENTLKSFEVGCVPWAWMPSSVTCT